MTESAQQNNFSEAIEQLLLEIDANIQAIGALPFKHLSESTRTALIRVPRHEFVAAEYRSKAYENRALPIGQGQTISQPLIVAVMTQLLDPKKTDRILEIGTGCGYQAAVLAQSGAEVFTIEVIASLAEEAKSHLTQLGYNNIHVLTGNGSDGWPENAPFDKIIITACSAHISETLLTQLRPGGCMIVPLGARGGSQILTLVHKDEANVIHKQGLFSVSFVPFV